MFDSIKQWLSDFINSIVEKVLQWVFDFAMWIPKKLYAYVCDHLASWIESIVPPDFMNQAVNLLAQWGNGAGYIFDLIEFNWGVHLVLTAILLRWAWAKIPFLGRGL